MSKWSTELTMQFVTAYIKNECLWNFRNGQFKNKNARLQAYNMMKENLNIPNFGVKDIIKKIKIIRSTYSQELRKIKESKRYCSDTDGGVYVPCLKWFPILDNALKRIKIENRTSQDNFVPVSEPEIADDSNAAIDQKPIILKVFTSESSVDNEHSISRTTDSTLHIDNNETRSAILHRHPRKRSLKDLHSRAKKLKSLTEMVKASAHESSEHEFDIFGRSVGAQLKAMPIVKALQAQQHIQNYITGLRLQQVAKTATNPLSYDDPFDSTSPSASP